MEGPDMASDGVEENENANDDPREKTSKVVNPRRSLVGWEREAPPDDDCCPICFGDFNIPCKANCGHWFCASCILMLWNYGSALQRCKCPMCSCLINKLMLEASLTLRQEEEVVEAVKKVQRYNRLFVGGALGLTRKLHHLPQFLWRFGGGLLDPDRLRLNYYTARLIALLLTLFYESFGFEFIPTGRLGVRRAFEFTAIALVLLLLLLGIGYRWILRRRVRLLAAPHPGHA